jgi:PTS system nitrogen regulatory IIA component
MRVRELLTSERTHFQVQGVSKKRLLDQAAQMAAATCKDLSEQQIFDALVARERQLSGPDRPVAAT